MPVENRWYEFKRDNITVLESGMLGIYKIGDINKIPVYIGSSTSPQTNIRGRLLSHLRNKRCPKGKYFQYTQARIFDDPKQMESVAVFAHARKYRKLPIYIKAYPKLNLKSII